MKTENKKILGLTEEQYDFLKPRLHNVFDFGSSRTKLYREFNKKFGKDLIEREKEIIEEEMRKIELKQHYEELRQMIIYELGLPGGFWADFQNTLHRMEQEDADAKALAELQRKQAEWRREQIRSEVETNLLVVAGVILGAAYLVALMWAVSLHRENQLPVPWGS
jgi:hypothetical protein